MRHLIPITLLLALVTTMPAASPAPAASGPKLRLEVTSFSVNRVKSQSANGKKATREIETGFNIRVTNDGPGKAEGLTVEYKLFQNKPKAAGFTRTEKTENLKPINLRDTTEIKTVALLLIEQDKPNGTVKEPANDLEGIWIRVLKDGAILAEFVTNDAIKSAGWGKEPQRRGRRGG